MVAYIDYKSKKEYDGWGSPYHNCFNLDVQAKDTSDLNIRLSRALDRLVNQKSIKRDYKNIEIALPTVLVADILKHSLEHDEEVEIYNDNGTLNTSAINSTFGNPRIVSEVIKNKQEWVTIKPIFDKYFNAKDSDNLEKIIISLSLFFILNELINIDKYSHSQYIRFSSGEIDSIVSRNKVTPFSGHSGAVKENTLFNGLIEQYHRLQFAHYEHTEKLVDFIVKELVWENGKPGYYQNNIQGQKGSLITIEEKGEVSEIADKIYSRI